MTYIRSTAVEYFKQIEKKEDFWIAVGNFLDDFRSTNSEEQKYLIKEPISTKDIKKEQEQFAVFFAGMIEELCNELNLEMPEWINNEIFFLEKPWFLHEYWKLLEWQLNTTPLAFKRRNIFGGDNLLSRI